MALNNCPMKKFKEQTDIQTIIGALIMNHTHTVVFTQAPLEKTCNSLMVFPDVYQVYSSWRKLLPFVTGNFSFSLEQNVCMFPFPSTPFWAAVLFS